MKKILFVFAALVFQTSPASAQDISGLINIDRVIHVLNFSNHDNSNNQYTMTLTTPNDEPNYSMTCSADGTGPSFITSSDNIRIYYFDNSDKCKAVYRSIITESDIVKTKLVVNDNSQRVIKVDQEPMNGMAQFHDPDHPHEHEGEHDGR